MEFIVILKFLCDPRKFVLEDTSHNITVVEILGLRYATFEGINKDHVEVNSNNREVNELAENGMAVFKDDVAACAFLDLSNRRVGILQQQVRERVEHCGINIPSGCTGAGGC